MLDLMDGIRDGARFPDRASLDEARRRMGGAWRQLRGEPVAPSIKVRRSRLRTFVSLGLGAALAYFLDPERGRTRRARARDRTTAFMRNAANRSARWGRRVSSDSSGLVEKLRYQTKDYQAPNDATLAAKVESELFGRPDVPKGSIVINAEQGTVVLRGQVDEPAKAEELERLVREIDGVEAVENLLHVPGTPAPNKQAARRAGSG